ncbi:uncharacterized protein AB675_3436 [Cyphellophora attinorum]|uniref:Uncharacterized protein n=1 Tax=Cyphellophora attinorum TaxID=1664694 RepID=A0A0N1H3W3_9EURO|nr:uncharacterized protein AB675_3436 [Phialophora attinorum]KPI39713.1 hypothetical protein AB675_3436 [Phialophora attinorum]
MQNSNKSLSQASPFFLSITIRFYISHHAEDTETAPANQEQVLQHVLQRPQCKVTEILPLVLQALSNSKNPEVRHFHHKLQEDLEPAAEALDELLKAFAALAETISKPDLDTNDKTKALHAEIIEGDQSICEFIAERLANALTFCYGHLGIESIRQGETHHTSQVKRTRSSSGVRAIETPTQDDPQPPPTKRAKLTQSTVATTDHPIAQYLLMKTPALHILRAAGIHPTHPPLNAHLACLLPQKLGDVPKPFRREVDDLRRTGELMYCDELEEALRVGALVDGHCAGGGRRAGCQEEVGEDAVRNPAGTRLAVYQDVMVRMMEGWWAAKDEVEAEAKKQSLEAATAGGGEGEMVQDSNATQPEQDEQQDELPARMTAALAGEVSNDSCEAEEQSTPKDDSHTGDRSHFHEQTVQEVVDIQEPQVLMTCNEEVEAPAAEEEDAPGEKDTEMEA